MLSVKYAVVGGFLSAAAFAAPSAAVDVNVPSGKYVLDPTHASLTWKVNHFGLSNYTARFTDFDIALDLDVEDVEKSAVTVSIDASSVRTDYKGDADFDAEITEDSKFLNSSDFPLIQFTSKQVAMTGDGLALIHGDMTMLGVTKPLTLKAKLNGTMAAHPYAKVPAVGFHAEGSLKRSDFGFEYLIPYVGDEVSFTVEAEFLKQK